MVTTHIIRRKTVEATLHRSPSPPPVFTVGSDSLVPSFALLSGDPSVFSPGSTSSGNPESGWKMPATANALDKSPGFSAVMLAAELSVPPTRAVWC